MSDIDIETKQKIAYLLQRLNASFEQIFPHSEFVEALNIPTFLQGRYWQIVLKTLAALEDGFSSRLKISSGLRDNAEIVSGVRYVPIQNVGTILNRKFPFGMTDSDGLGRNLLHRMRTTYNS